MIGKVYYPLVSRPYYAVRQKSTGWFLPQILHKYGYTSTEPVPMATSLPRLHKSPDIAKRALLAWLKGHAHVKTTRSHEDPSLEPAGSICYVPVMGRKAEDMEIVEMLLGIIGVVPDDI